MAHKIQLRGGSSSLATSENPLLLARELGVETDTGLFKMGNGTDLWNDLPYGGLHGEKGNRVELRFKNAEFQPLTPTGEVPAGWLTYPTTPTVPEVTWITTAVLDHNDILLTTWSAPSRLSGEQGEQGDKGDTGDTGSKGDPGGTSSPWEDSPTVYSSGDVTSLDGIVWISIQDANEGNVPAQTENIWWKRWAGNDPVISLQSIVLYGEEPADARKDKMPAGTQVLPLDGRMESLDGSIATTVGGVNTEYESSSPGAFYTKSLYADTIGELGIENADLGSLTMNGKCYGIGIRQYMDSNDDSAFVNLIRLKNSTNSTFLTIAGQGDGAVQEIGFSWGDGTTANSLIHGTKPVEGQWNFLAIWFNPTEDKTYCVVNGVVETATGNLSGLFTGDMELECYGANDTNGLSFHTEEAFWFIRDDDLTTEEMGYITGHYASGNPWELDPYFDALHIFGDLDVDGVVSSQAVVADDVKTNLIRTPDAAPLVDLLRGMDSISFNITSPEDLFTDRNSSVFYSSSGIAYSVFDDTNSPIPGEKYVYGASANPAGSTGLSVYDKPAGVHGEHPEVITFFSRMFFNNVAPTGFEDLWYVRNYGNTVALTIQANDTYLKVVYRIDGVDYDGPVIACSWDNAWHYLAIRVRDGQQIILRLDGNIAFDSGLDPQPETPGDMGGEAPIESYREYFNGAINNRWLDPAYYAGIEEGDFYSHGDAYRALGNVAWRDSGLVENVDLNLHGESALVSDVPVILPGNPVEDFSAATKKFAENIDAKTAGGVDSANLYSVDNPPPYPSSFPKVAKLLCKGTYSTMGCQLEDGRVITWNGTSNASQVASGQGVVIRQPPTEVRFPLTETGTLIDIEINGQTGYALFDSGNLYVWGYNDSGQLGLGDTTDRSLPTFTLAGVSKVWGGIKLGSWSHTQSRLFVQKTDGTIWGCGENSNGQLGINTSSDQLTWAEITGLGTNLVQELWNCGNHRGCTFALMNDDTLLATGSNAEGQLGIGSTTNPLIFTDCTAAWGGSSRGSYQITGAWGDYDGSTTRAFGIVVMLRGDGSVYTCGYGSSGSLGNGATGNISTPHRIQDVTILMPDITMLMVLGGAYYADVYALDDTGTLWVWGRNSRGRQFRGSIVQVNSPTAIAGYTVIELLGENGGTCYADPFAMPAFIRLDDGHIYSAGDGASYVLGTADQSAIDKYIPTLTQLPDNVIDIAYGGYNEGAVYCSALTDDGKMLVWGYNGRYNLHKYGNDSVAMPLCLNKDFPN